MDQQPSQEIQVDSPEVVALSEGNTTVNVQVRKNLSDQAIASSTSEVREVTIATGALIHSVQPINLLVDLNQSRENPSTSTYIDGQFTDLKEWDDEENSQPLRVGDKSRSQDSLGKSHTSEANAVLGKFWADYSDTEETSRETATKETKNDKKDCQTQGRGRGGDMPWEAKDIKIP